MAASAAVAKAFVCTSTDVVVAGTDDWRRALEVATGLGAPLVYGNQKNLADPSALGAARVWTNRPQAVIPGKFSIFPLPDVQSPTAPIAGSMVDGAPHDQAVREVVEATDETANLALVSSQRPDLAAPAAAAAHAVGGEAVWARPVDLRNHPVLAPLIRGSSNRVLVGNFGPDAAWQADVVGSGKALPGGGQVIFPGRRIVALYGHPSTPALGVLGEQDPRQAVARAMEVAAPYTTDQATALPAFELIATLATAGAGPDGDYSAESSIETLMPWVQAATDAGLYVVLDLQPGRTDFLTQAKRYEELLKRPDVGLALDPEWRLGPGERHLQTIGSVSAAEINTVVDWLAQLVRVNRLPQKLLIVHQFKHSMITQRGEVKTPPELAVVLQMDGQGPLSTKYDTWGALTAEEGGWKWGWKSFYDEDHPMATPAEVLALEPRPVFISFQ